MRATLRPMALGEILDRTFEIYRKRFLVFVGLAAMPAFAMVGVHLADILWLHVSTLAHPDWRPGEFMWAFVLSICFYHVRSIVNIPFVPALVNLASKTEFGEQDSVLGSLRVSAARLRCYIWIGILKQVAELVIPEIVAMVAMLGIGAIGELTGYFDSHPESPVLVLLLFIVPAALLIVFFLWLGACFSLAFPVAVFEETVGLKAMLRSWKLSKNSRGRIMVVWLMIAAFGSIVMFGLQLLYRDGMISTHQWPHLSSAWRMSYYAGAYSLNAIVSAFIGPLYPIATTLIYYDQRIRREGYDIEMMMEAAGLSEAALAAGAADPVEEQPQETEA